MEENLQYHFPDWLKDIDPQIGGKILSIVNENSIDEEQAKKLLDEKIKGNFFSKKDIDIHKMSLKIDNTFAINVEQKRHYEVRTISKKTVAYSDKFANVGFDDELEDLWQENPFENFSKQKLNWIRGGSAEISDCPQCNNAGKVRCQNCKGNGEYLEKCYKCSGKGIINNKCPNCNGRGKVTKGQITVGGGKRIGAGAGYSSREEQCLRCNATGYLSERCNKCSGQGQILVTCSKCKGSGILICSTCEGSGQLYTAESINATCELLEQSFIISKYKNVKSSWFKNDNIKSEYFEIDGFINIDDYGKPILNEGRVLLEGYNIKILPISYITIKNDRKDNSIFIVGKDKKVIGVVSSYLDYKKIFLFVVLPILVVIILLYFFIVK